MDEIDPIIDLLDFEIDRLRSEARQPGWTKWALIGAIGTCGWVFLSELADRAVSWPNVATVFLLSSIVWDVCVFLSSVLGVSEEISPSETRIILSKALFGRTRFSALFELVRVFVLLVMGSRLLPGGFLQVCFRIWYGTFAVTFLVGVLISFCELPLPAGRAKTPFPIIVFLVLLLSCALAGIFGIAQKLSVLDPLPSVYEWRTAVLIVAIVTLLGILVRTEREKYLLPSFISIRRSLALGRIDIETAKEQIDVALSGLRIDQMFHKDLSEILGYFSSVNAEIDEVSKERAIIEEKRAAGQDLGENEKTVIEALMRSSLKHLESIKKTIQSVRNRLAKMSRKIWRVRFVAPGCVEEVKAVVEKVLKGIESVDEKVESLQQQFGVRRGEDEGGPLET